MTIAYDMIIVSIDIWDIFFSNLKQFYDWNQNNNCSSNQVEILVGLSSTTAKCVLWGHSKTACVAMGQGGSMIDLILLK